LLDGLLDMKAAKIGASAPRRRIIKPNQSPDWEGVLKGSSLARRR
jgi:hypothetical protein